MRNETHSNRDKTFSEYLERKIHLKNNCIWKIKMWISYFWAIDWQMSTKVFFHEI